MGLAIEIKNLSFAYGDGLEQLKNINLTIHQGEVIALTGPSGSGKSTLTKVINGLVPYFYEGNLTGQVSLMGKNLADIPTWERGRFVGNVFQDPRSQFFANEVAGEIAFGCENYGFSHDEIIQSVHSASASLGVEDILEQKVRLLSYGMRQRVAIASAKAIDPPIFVLDEPSANLDMAATLAFATLIKDLKAQGKTILVAEHRLYYLRDIADRVVFLEDGQIKGIFTPQQMEALPFEQIEEKGLRSLDLSSLATQVPIHQNGAKIQLQVKGLCKTFGDTTVASDIDFSCRQGEVVAVVGPNGVGKSTLGKMIAGLLKEDAGEVLYEGRKLKRTDRRGKVWYIMQDLDSQLFGENLMDELLTGRKETPERKEKAKGILDALGLSELVEQHPATLSGGQKQRLALGVALIYEAPVIILDEPTSGLDGKNMRNVGKLIRDLAQKGHTILMITHDVECALAACDRAICMRDGRIAEDFMIDNASRLLQAMQ